MILTYPGGVPRKETTMRLGGPGTRTTARSCSKGPWPFPARVPSLTPSFPR